MKVAKLIRNIVDSDGETNGMKTGVVVTNVKKYVIVVEHDLLVLDYIAAYVQSLYGATGAYGVVTSRTRVRNGINQFLAGYIKYDNMRFRDHALTFKVTISNPVVEPVASRENIETGGGIKAKPGVYKYTQMTRILTREDEEGNGQSRLYRDHAVPEGQSQSARDRSDLHVCIRRERSLRRAQEGGTQ